MISLFKSRKIRKKLLIVTLVLNLFFGVFISLLVSSPSIVKAQLSAEVQLSAEDFVDVQPTDFYYEALRNLTERYGCAASYPDGTFRGNNFITRFEMAASLAFCMDQSLWFRPEWPVNLATKSEVEEFQNRIDTLQQKVNRLLQ